MWSGKLLQVRKECLGLPSRFSVLNTPFRVNSAIIHSFKLTTYQIGLASEPVYGGSKSLLQLQGILLDGCTNISAVCREEW
jgi:hypothetical protein